MMSALVALALAAQDDGERVKAAVERALPLIRKSALEYTEQRTCFSCHHQALPLYALSVARERGLASHRDDESAQVKFTLASLERGRKAYLEGRGQGGRAATASYGLWALEVGGHKPDATTEAVAEFLLRDREGDHWKPPSNRPPSEASPFTTTAFSIRAIQAFGTEAQKERVKERIEKARAWLVSARPKETEDRVFRLWGLKYSGAEEKDVREAARELSESRRPDGGWAQVADRPSDAYATGSALAALHEAGGMAASDPVYRAGLKFLLSTQKEDGSWHVATRSKPIQAYFESGFPHGKDQFISMNATCWAVAAMCLGLGP